MDHQTRSLVIQTLLRAAHVLGAQDKKPSAPEARAWAAEARQRLGLKVWDVWLSGGNDLKLGMFEVEKAERKQGVGSRAMEELCDYADQHGFRVVLTPALPDDRHGTTSRSRLVTFYKRFGFKENKGRSKDFAISEGMYRDPKPTRMSAHVLEASRLDDLKARNPGLTAELDQLEAGDPSSTKKYLAWMLKQVKAKEPIKEVIGLVQQFDKIGHKLSRKDINQYKTLGDLRGEIEGAAPSKGELIRDIKKDADYLYDDGRFLLVHPKTMAASCHFGRGAKWCISATESRNYFNTYSGRNVFFYFLIDREAKAGGDWSKVAICLNKEDPSYHEYFDAADKSTDPDSIGDPMGSKIVEVLPIAEADVRTRPDNWQWLLGNSTDSDVISRIFREHKQEIDPDTMQELADNEMTPSDVLDTLAERDDEYLSTSVASNRNTSPEVLLKLAKSGSGDIRFAVARNSHAPEEALLLLAADPDFRVRSAVAKNPNTKGEVESILAKDSSASIRGEIAESTWTDPDVLVTLLQDTDWQVRVYALRNRNTPDEALTPLAKDTNPKVRLALSKRGGLSAEAVQALLQDNNEDINFNLAQNPSTSAEGLQQLAGNDSVATRVQVSQNPGTTEETLRLLSKDENDGVRARAEDRLRSL
jgi:GNAT superfamily N-acetyltransferase